MNKRSFLRIIAGYSTSVLYGEKENSLCIKSYFLTIYNRAAIWNLQFERKLIVFPVIRKIASPPTWKITLLQKHQFRLEAPLCASAGFLRRMQFSRVEYSYETKLRCRPKIRNREGFPDAIPGRHPQPLNNTTCMYIQCTSLHMSDAEGLMACRHRGP